MKTLYKTSSILLLFFAITFVPFKAMAHRIFVFAWAEGNKIHGEVSFSGNGKNKNGIHVPVSIRDSKNNRELFTKQTDNLGKFSFPITDNLRKNRTDLLLIANTGEGHRGEWRLPASDYLTGTALPATDSASAEKESSPVVSVNEQQNEDEARLRRIIDQELERRLGPIRKQLAEQKDPPPGLRDVLGGLGFLFGLAGLLIWSRKTNGNKQESNN